MGELERYRHHVVGGDQSVDEAVFDQVVAGGGGSGEQQLAGDREGQVAGQGGGATHGRDEAERHLGEAQLDPARHHSEVAGEHQFHPAGDGVAVDRRHERLTEVVVSQSGSPPKGRVVDHPLLGFGLRLPGAGHEGDGRSEVEPGAEGGAHGPGDHDGSDAVIGGERLPRFGQRHDQLGIEGVPGFGPVEGDHGDVVVDGRGEHGHRPTVALGIGPAPRPEGPGPGGAIPISPRPTSGMNRPARSRR